ncbi:MAG: GAF domain-containing protein [Thermoplasmata archaeon]|nr:GAF domain-containing protein [Thermoplasmata archaeon]
MTIADIPATAARLQLNAILSRLAGRQALAEICRYLRAEFRHFNWVGVYRLEGDRLILAAWDGAAATEHVEIPLGQGVCGRAAREKRTVVVGDVQKDPEYLACFIETRSEIVVPVYDGPLVVGEIDIDGDRVNAYDASDARFLESVARLIVEPLRATSGEPAAT